MTAEELESIEQQARSADSPLGENCVRLVQCLRASRAAKALLSRQLDNAVQERDEAREAARHALEASARSELRRQYPWLVED